MFGWVDFSQEERDRASNVLALLREKGAVDELGIGAIRDAFSGKFFPGTSTLHTRPRYLYLIPYLCKDLEKEHAGEPVEQLAQKFYEGERTTCEKLVVWSEGRASSNIEETGIVGATMLKESSWVKRPPSQLYWSALSTYGLLRGNGNDEKRWISRNDMLKLISAKIPDSAPDEAENDDTSGTISTLWDVPSESYRTWNSGGQIQLMLTQEEANDLRSRILNCDENSLYADLLRLDTLQEIHGLSFVQFIDLMKDQKARDQKPTRSQQTFELCEHAANFSSLVALLHIRFNFILQRNGGGKPSSSSDNAVVEWSEHYLNEDSLYWNRALGCDIEAIYDKLNLWGNERGNKTYRFLKDSIEALKDGRIEGSNRCLDNILINREKSLKGPARSKIRNAERYREGWYGGRDLSYRFEIALSFAEEINASLGGETP